MPQLPATSVSAGASTGQASGEQGMTRPLFVRRRLERRDDATEALEEAKEVRASRAVHGLSKRLQALARAAMQGRGCLIACRFTGGPCRRCTPEQPLLADW